MKIRVTSKAVTVAVEGFPVFNWRGRAWTVTQVYIRASDGLTWWEASASLDSTPSQIVTVIRGELPGVAEERVEQIVSEHDPRN